MSYAIDKKLEKLTDKDTRQDIDASQASDLKFVEALKKVGEGKAEVITYKANGTNLTAALVLRLDPEKGEGYETAFEDSRQSLLLGIKFEEFDKDVQAVADKITYEINSRAYKMCDPRNFVLA